MRIKSIHRRTGSATITNDSPDGDTNGLPDYHQLSIASTVNDPASPDSSCSPNGIPWSVSASPASNVEPGHFASRDRSTGRLVRKRGDCNVTSRNVDNRKLKYFSDLFTTIVDMQWRWHLVIAPGAFVTSWVAFAVAWLVVLKVHGDFDQKEGNGTETSACASAVYDFPSALLLSIETQTTIGYGVRATQQDCHRIAICLIMLQSCVGVSLTALVTGLMFAKLSRPKRRSQTIMFSRRAVILKRDAEYQLLFRVGDMRRSHFIGTSLRAIHVSNRRTEEGEAMSLYRHQLSLETDIAGFVFLVWPVTVVHRINSSSPLWKLSAKSLLTGPRFEIVVILEGTIESTGMFAQVRTSYVSEEILWGERLSPLLTYEHHNGSYEIDYSRFHRTIPVPMPDCSACEWEAEMRRRASGIQADPDNRSSLTDDDLDDDTDYSINFTVQSRPPPPTSSPVWSLFQKQRSKAFRRTKTDDGSFMRSVSSNN